MQSSRFEILISPSRAVRALSGPLLGGGAPGQVLAGWHPRGNPDGWVFRAFGVLMLWAGWRHGRVGLAWGTLRVDDAGDASWEGDGRRGQARRAPRPGQDVPRPGQEYEQPGLPAKVERWFAGERLAWVRLRTADGQRHEILCGRGTIDADSWRRLASWLAWLGRGQAPR